MGNFNDAVEFVLKNEGGLSENERDPGGITNFGISLRFIREFSPEKLKTYGIFAVVDDKTIRELTKDQAILIYKNEFWAGSKLDEINTQELCNYIFDMFVNHGSSRAIKLSERAICAYYFDKNYASNDSLMIDILNKLPTFFITVLAAMRAQYFYDLALFKDQEVFLDGWLTRCYGAP